MDAIIMAAGLGTRLRPHTLTTPKPLLPIRGRPILDWALGALPRSIDRLIVVVHYLAEQIEAYLKKQPHIADWVAVPQGEPQGTGHAFQCCRDHVRSDRVLVLNGDDLYGAADLAALASCPAGLLVHEVDQPRLFGIAFRKPDGTLEKLVEKPPLDGTQLANTGAYLFPREAFDIPLTKSPRNEYEITEVVSKLAERRPFCVVEAKYWLPIGNVEVWAKAQAEDLEAVLTPRG
jgi:bifunctional UDP-N-acetylglucosamine pyrophosphorylase/glucosamine-1-phosphate N-acetyltransferase